MLDKLEKCVSYGEELGADFVEVRYDDLTLRTLQRVDDIWEDIQSKSRLGVGITAYVGGVEGFSFTPSKELKDIQSATEKAFKLAKASAKSAKLKLPFDSRPAIKSKRSDTISVKIHPRDVELDHKIDLVNRVVETSREYGQNIRSIKGRWGELHGLKVLLNSDGSTISWDFLITDYRINVTSKTDSGSMVEGRVYNGGSFGLEEFEKRGKTPEEMGKEAALTANEQLKAKSCPAGNFRALVEEELVGVLAHESFGHLSEADSVVRNASPLAGKIGEKIGSEHASIVDGGVPDIKKHGGLWLPYDDQGTASNQTTILNEGVLGHYLHTRGTAEKLEQQLTGNARAINFMYPVIPRMTNTYFQPGDLSEEEALEKLGTGVYAIQSTGGQVTGDGSFVFKAVRGYWVENGEIQYPIREVALSGNILDLLQKVEGCTKELKLGAGYFGGCGKGGQYPLPVGDGGPKLVIESVTFGGQA